MTSIGHLGVRRILVIDDQEEIHADFRKVLRRTETSLALERARAQVLGTAADGDPEASLPRFEVVSARQGQEGVRAASRAREERAPFCVAFVDMRMPPGWDGVTTIRELWEIDSNVQVVICTAYSDESLDLVSAKLGHADKLLVLKKPFEPIEVLQLATALSEKWRAERDAELRVEDLRRLVRERTADIERAALHDRLTGLPNRALLLERLTGCIRLAQRDVLRRFALLFLDLDGFKRINDTLGHEVGDQLLLAVADRLRKSLRSSDTISSTCTPARLGGDEFLVLLESLNDAAGAARVAERLVRALAEPYEVGPHRISITASIGVASGDRGYHAAADIVRDADIAMYRAKAAGRARFLLFDENMHREITARLSLEAALRTAVQEDTLELHYQPIVRLSDGRLRGFEALVRWTRPEHGPVPASELISVAEETGLIQTLGLQLLRRSCRQLAEWHDAIPGAREVGLSVNLSRRQLVDPEFSLRVAEVILESGVDATKLGLEVTETSVLHDLDAAVAALRRLRGLGAAILLDDFGSGYSAISHLHQMPLSAMKIDRSFLTQAHADPRHAIALQAVVSIAKGFGLDVVAEGIETSDQLELLEKLGIEVGQGFLYSRAVPAEEAAAMLRSGRRLGPRSV